MKILQKGDNLGPALRIIECYLLLGETEALSGHMPVILAALEKAVQSILEYKESPRSGPQFGKMRGGNHWQP